MSKGPWHICGCGQKKKKTCVGKLPCSKGRRFQGRASNLSKDHSSPSLLPKLFDKNMFTQVNYSSSSLMCHPLWYYFHGRYFTSATPARGAQLKGKG